MVYETHCPVHLSNIKQIWSVININREGYLIIALWYVLNFVYLKQTFKNSNYISFKDLEGINTLGGVKIQSWNFYQVLLSF